jgi:hypothetical protein
MNARNNFLDAHLLLDVKKINIPNLVFHRTISKNQKRLTNHSNSYSKLSKQVIKFQDKVVTRSNS